MEKMSTIETSNGSKIPMARRRIARIRCFRDCIKSFQEKKPFPEALCYVPSEMEYVASSKGTWKLYEEPNKNTKIVKEVTATLTSRVMATGEEMCNSDGKWLKVIQIKMSSNEVYETVPGGHAWLLLFSSRSSTEELPVVVPLNHEHHGKLKGNPKKQKFKVNNWEAYIEETCSLLLKKDKSEMVPPDHDAVKKLRSVEDGWCVEHDAALIQLMSKNVIKVDDNVGCLRNYVESLDVSSYSSGEGEASHLTDENPSTFWETDGTQGQHWIRLRMKKGTIVKCLSLTVNMADDNYLPEQIVVLGGEAEDLKVLSNTTLNWTPSSPTDIKLLENCSEHYRVVNIRIKACKAGGIDTRIRGIKLRCQEERSMGLDLDYFSGNNLVRFPILQSYSPSVLYRRSIVLQRFIWLLDSVMHCLVPVWQHSIENVQNVEGKSLAGLEGIRQILPLSKKRLNMIETWLRSTASDLSDRKIVYINRHAALEHRANPAASTDFSNTVFMQLYEGLQPKDRSSSPLTYRWSSQVEQWWECKFISEGIIDQGGGFRDSLSDIAEELCPSDSEAPYALPFFVRAPNQDQDDGNVNKDVYVPNPNCTDFTRLEWLGQLLGACFRSKEILILPLAPYIWKRLSGESYNWSEDFSTVDAAEVTLIDNLTKMDRETFEASGRCWSLVLSDGSHVSLKLDSKDNPLPLAYGDREEYAAKVREIRMAEFDKQLKAIKNGLLKVLPDAVLNLLTWQELETQICGEPEITVEGLMRSTYYHNLEEDSLRVKQFWIAVKNFSNEDRSKLLRFITGRRRLPVNIFLSSGKSNPIDPLPESSTCCNTLHLPVYSDAKAAEEKLRYAAYNCVSIDTDE